MKDGRVKCNVGDWVRFMRSGLVIEEVRYIGEIDGLGRRHYVTDTYEIHDLEILEVRPITTTGGG
jgi:hypothetical protein